MLRSWKLLNVFTNDPDHSLEAVHHKLLIHYKLQRINFVNGEANEEEEDIGFGDVINHYGDDSLGSRKGQSPMQVLTNKAILTF